MLRLNLWCFRCLNNSTNRFKVFIIFVRFCSLYFLSIILYFFSYLHSFFFVFFFFLFSFFFFLIFRKSIFRIFNDFSNILGLPRNMSTRRSTKAFKAFEGRRNSIMAMKKKSSMQTLGANNIYGAPGNQLGIQPRPTRSSQISVKEVFADAGQVNPGYEAEESPRNSLRLQPMPSQIGWRDLNSKM